jgi:hypothetical protein
MPKRHILLTTSNTLFTVAAALDGPADDLFVSQQMDRWVELVIGLGSGVCFIVVLLTIVILIIFIAVIFSTSSLLFCI